MFLRLAEGIQAGSVAFVHGLTVERNGTEHPKHLSQVDIEFQ